MSEKKDGSEPRGEETMERTAHSMPSSTHVAPPDRTLIAPEEPRVVNVGMDQQVFLLYRVVQAVVCE